MTVTITHTKVSTIPDGPDTTIVRPSDWNATHTLVGLGTAAELDAGVANGVATLDGSGKIPVSELPAAVLGALSYQGTWNASTNTPTLASGVGTKGYYYVVSVAGSTNLDGITSWVVGDWAVYNGTAWQKVDNTDAVTSVNGQTGTVVLTNTDISGFGTMSTQNATSVAVTGGTINGTTIGATTASTGAFTTVTSSTSVTTPTVQATNSGGLALKNSAGTTQISMGAGGGDNVSVNVSTNLNGSNAQIDISPTGTGHVHIKPTGAGAVEIAPTNAGTINNMVIGGITPNDASFVNLSVTGTTSFDGAQGTAGQVLTSAGTGATPTWTTPTTGTVTSVTGTAPVVSSGGATPAISMAAATSAVDGYLTSTDWTTFNSKGSGSVTSVAASVPSFLSITGSPITSSGTLAISYSGTALPIANGGTGLTALGTGVQTAIGVNVGTAGAFVVNGGALGTPSSGTVTNLTGTASININGTVGATTPTTGAFTTLSTSGVATFSAGAVGTPSITTASDTNTGIFFPAADTIAFAEGGVEAMRIDSNGNMGIGEVSPSSKLEVAGTGANNAGAKATYEGTIKINEAGSSTLQATGGLEFKGSVFGSGYGSKIFSTDAGDLLFGNRNNSATWSERMRISNSGNVGIGTTSPNYKLEISTDSAGKPGVGGLWTVVSDERIKSNIVPANLDRCYEIVKSVPLKHFGFAAGVYNNDQIQDKHNLGWIAQDVQKVFKNAVSAKPFTLKTDILDGVEEYEEQDFTLEKVEKTETSIQIINGKAIQVLKIVTSENKVLAFDTVNVLNEAGAVVMDGDKPLTYQMPRMITKTRPKVRHDVIEDCLDLNGGQMIAALYGAVQALMAIVDTQAERIAALEGKA